MQEGEELPPVEQLPDGADSANFELYTYPRLDKLFERGLKTQVVLDVTQVQAAGQDKKGAPQKGAKDPKKPVEDEKPLEESQYVKDMKAAIKIEKALLRFRLTQIRNWTLKRLREMRQKAIKTYQKLEDWIQVSTLAENEAVNQMSGVIKTAIEEERKIQDELRIKFMDFCVDEKIMYYVVPPPERLPPLEEYRQDRFSVAQLRNVVDEIISLSEQQNNALLPNKVVTDLLIRKLQNSTFLTDEGTLMDEWKRFSEYDFQSMVRNLDKYHQGSIDWRALATILILLRSEIPTDKQLEQYKAEFKADMLTKDEFVTVSFGF